MSAQKSTTLSMDEIEPIVPGKDLDRKSAAAYIAERTGRMTYVNLGNLANAGTGPLMRFVGNKSYYRISDLDDWIRSYVAGPSRRTRRYLRADALK